MNTIPKVLPLLVALAGLSAAGCDMYDPFPITAKEAGMPTAKLKVATGTLGLELLPDSVADVKVQISDIWMRRATDGAWVALHSGPVTMSLADAGGSVELGMVYVPKGTYDYVSVQLDSMKVMLNAGWMGVYVEEPELTWQRQFDVTNDGRLRLDVVVSRGLEETAPGWVGRPSLSFDLQD